MTVARQPSVLFRNVSGSALAAVLAVVTTAIGLTPASARQINTADLVGPCRPWIDQVPIAQSGEAQRSGQTICFAGDIDSESSARLIQTVQSADTSRPLVLVLRSPGGNVPAALDVAEAIVPLNVTSVAHSICASSCANYLFMAADVRVVGHDAALIWHGGWSLGFLRRRVAELDRLETRRNADPEEVEQLRALVLAMTVGQGMYRQDAFLRSIDADPRFFEAFDAINDKPRRRWSADCARQPQAGTFMLSDAFLDRYGLTIDVNEGPKDAVALSALLQARGNRGLACFWAEDRP